VTRSTIIPDRYDKQFIQGLIDRIAVLERDAYVRGQDVPIGVPEDTSRTARVPRLIMTDPVNGERWWVRVRGGAWEIIAL